MIKSLRLDRGIGNGMGEVGNETIGYAWRPWAIGASRWVAARSRRCSACTAAQHIPALPSGAGTGAGVPRGADGATGRVTSNILRGDYAGSESCATCHAEVFAHWRGSPMHLMTRLPEGAAIRAPFDGAAFRFKDDRAQLTQKDGARFVRLASTQFGNHLYRVTRVIGGRYREDFAGVEIPDEAAPAVGRRA